MAFHVNSTKHQFHLQHTKQNNANDYIDTVEYCHRLKKIEAGQNNVPHTASEELHVGIKDPLASVHVQET
jgi:hypothetical protein